MKITPQIVDHVANLARLSLSGEERERMISHMAGILSYMDLLSELDLSRVPATAQVTETANVFREDTPVPSQPVERHLANAPDRAGTAFRVPRIIEE